MDKAEFEYLMAYGGLPSSREALRQYVREKYPCDEKKLDELRQYVHDLGWYRNQYALLLIPKPTPRPRLSGTGFHFYVKGARENKQFIHDHITRNIAYTRTIILMRAYVPTPSSMNRVEKNAAEEGFIMPTYGADVDNIMKTYMDAIQGWLLINDNIVQFSALGKYWSIKPRLEIELLYQDRFDCHFNKKAMTSTKVYQRYLEDQVLDLYHEEKQEE